MKLKSGGLYAIIDHSAKDGSSVTDIQLHRIDDSSAVKCTSRVSLLQRGQARSATQQMTERGQPHLVLLENGAVRQIVLCWYSRSHKRRIVKLRLETQLETDREPLFD